jgi:hypothetical protein
MDEETEDETTTIEADIPIEIEERLTDYCTGHGVTADEVISVALLEFLDGREPEVEY